MLTDEEFQLLEHLEATHSQVKAAMGVLRTTSQLLAQARELIDQASTAREAQQNGHKNRHHLTVGR